mmetsp:Transcript_63726/g.101414  ORF Transcript_63726/g.101414 Transcript_63726/m.101414 type:complete len:368 (+) Transcript_63726:30-1133(+)
MATPTSTVIFEGQLMKKGQINTAWKNRWCVVSQQNGNLRLLYYESKLSKHLCGSIEFLHIYDVKAVLPHKSSYDLNFLGRLPMNIKLTNELRTELKYAFIVYTRKRKYYFAAFDPKNFEQWMNLFDKYICCGVLKRGYLQKRGGTNTAFKRRYFVLKNNKMLKYYANESCDKYLGSIPLNAVIKLKAHKDKDKYTFHLVTENRIWILCAPTFKDRKQWMSAISKCKDRRFHHKSYSLLDNSHETWHSQETDSAVESETHHKDSQIYDGFDSNAYHHMKHNHDAEEEEKKEREEQENMDNANVVIQSDNYSNVENKNNNNNNNLNEGYEGDAFLVEWKCSQCQQTYATQWPRCPGCNRTNTHYSYTLR